MRLLSTIARGLGRFLVFALNPRLGRVAKPFSSFYRTMGGFFVSFFIALKLIDRTHPWAREGARVPMLQVLAYAWARTDWSRPWKPVPVSVMTVCLLLFVGSLTAGTAVVTGTVKAGDAYASGIFTTPHQSTDFALNYLRDTFGIKFGGADSAAPTGVTAIVEGFQQMMGIYSTAMLIIAGFVLLYLIVVAVADTAHSGRFGGSNFNQVWAPIRLVVAIGLLVPLPMGAYSGYNSGQYIVLKLSEWGSGLASNLWVPFATHLVSKNDVLVSGDIPSAAEAVRGVLVSEYCMARYEGANMLLGNTEPAMGRYKTVQGASVTYYYRLETSSTGRYCGAVFYEKPTSGESYIITLVQDYETAFVKMRQRVSNLAVALLGMDYIPIVGETPGAGNEENINDILANTSPVAGVDTFVMIVKQYQEDLAAAAKTAEAYHSTSAADAMTTEVEEAGWAGAGLWFNTIARLNAEYTSALRTLPQAAAPDYQTSTDFTTGLTKKISTDVREGVLVLQSQLLGVRSLLGATAAYGYGEDASTGISTSSVIAGLPGATDLRYFDETSETLGEFTRNASSAVGTAMAAVFDTALGGPFGHMGTGSDTELSEVYPLSQLAAIGDWMVDRSLVLWLGGKVPGLGILHYFAFIGVSAGLILLYLLPLLPFIRFLFGIIAWIVSILEAVIAIPLVALAHLSTGGSGISGDMARVSYQMIFSIFLRPALMIIGLICALMILSVAIGALNDMYESAVKGWMGTAKDAGGGLSVIMYTVLYVLIAYSATNMCFQLIEAVPDHALKWISFQSAGRDVTADDKVVQQVGQVGDNLVFGVLSRR